MGQLVINGLAIGSIYALVALATADDLHTVQIVISPRDSFELGGVQSASARRHA